MTRSLYYDDPYMRSTEARVVALHHLPEEEKTAVLLDRSIFYPEGGGQSGDRGSLGGHDVLDTQKASKLSAGLSQEIAHIIPFTEALKAGDEVELLLDWERRMDYMQQHSGQHLISAAFWHTGRHATASVHLGEELSTVEFAVDTLSPEEIARAASLANDAIAANLSIQARVMEQQELEALSLRRSIKVDGNIRIVEIAAFPDAAEGEPFDRVGCGGVHVSRSAEVRLIQHIRTERIRGRVRLYWKIGTRALRDYQLKNDICSRLSTMFSLPVELIPEHAEELQKERVVLRQRIREHKQESLNQQLHAHIAQGQGKAGEPALLFIVQDATLLRDAAKTLQQRGIERAVLMGSDNERTFWLILDSRKEHIDFSLLQKELLNPLGAKGGGRTPIWQGSMEKVDSASVDAKALLEKFRAFTDRQE